MSSYELVGGTDNLIHDGKAYRVGDAVPLTKEAKRSLEKSGVRFLDTDPAEVAAAQNATAATPAETAPRGDRGEVLDLPAPRARVTPQPAAPAPTRSE